LETASGYCLNCETPLQGKFCHSCGQKASTHRISFKKFIEHDLAHGIFHLDRGFLYTLKVLFLIPGHTARRYLAGKRVKHYNIFALFLIIIAIKTYIESQTVGHRIVSTPDPALDELFNERLKTYYKIIYFLYIPLVAFLSWALFGRLRYFFTEHMVAAAFALTSGLLVGFTFSLTGYLLRNEDYVLFGYFFAILFLAYPYYQISKHHYFFFAYLWRIIVIISLVAFSVMLGFGLILMMTYGKLEGKIDLYVGS
jgi:hypothetical protein